MGVCEKFLQCLAGFTLVKVPGISLCSEEAPQTEPRCLPCLLVQAFPLLWRNPICNFPNRVTDILGRPALFDTRTVKMVARLSDKLSPQSRALILING